MKKLIVGLSLLITNLFLSPTLLAKQNTLLNNVDIPEGFELADDWLQACQMVLGEEAAVMWISQQVSQNATLLYSKSQQSLILVRALENQPRRQMIAAMEAGMLEGNGTYLFLLDEVTPHNAIGLHADYAGTIDNKEVHVQRIALSDGCNGVDILMITPLGKSLDYLSLQPAIEYVAMDMQEEIAMIGLAQQ